jgi:hypothetical protein
VVAVEVHQATPDSPDLGFDLELCANVGTLRFPPRVAFLAPPDSSLHLLGQPIKLVAEAVSPVSTEGLSVTFYSDGQPLGSVGQTPYTLVWSNAPPGRHQLTAEARDLNGLKSSDFITLQVLRHLPPIVTITNPVPDQMFTTADQIPFDVEAYEIGGSIQRVDFYRKAHLPTFNEPEVFLGGHGYIRGGQLLGARPDPGGVRATTCGCDPLCATLSDHRLDAVRGHSGTSSHRDRAVAARVWGESTLYPRTYQPYDVLPRPHAVSDSAVVTSASARVGAGLWAPGGRLPQ